ncbi:MAG: tetratricopeptide repeat protein, partial [Bacteroidota bacterium]|nr:tetratricopeptide repeat protein [Bacteroidota bacterium]
ERTSAVPERTSAVPERTSAVPERTSAVPERSSFENAQVDAVSESQLLALARRLADQGALEEARSTAALAVEKVKMDPEAHFIYATILREMGETSQAIEEFNRALYLDHGYISAHFAMGSIYQHLGEKARAQRHLRNALELLRGCRDHDAIIDHGELTGRRMMDIIRTMLGEE